MNHTPNIVRASNPLRVGFDTSALDPSFKEHAQRGIGRYVSELKKYFDKHVSSPTNGISIEYFDHTHFAAGKTIDTLIQCAPLGRETLRQQLVYPLNLKKGNKNGLDVLHFPAQMDAPSWSPVPYVVTVLDLIPLVCKELYHSGVGGWRFHLARCLELRSIRNAKRVLVISENTGRDVHSILGVPWERISVTPLGVSPTFFSEISEEQVKNLQARYQIPAKIPTLLYVGGIDQRKNWRYMFEVLLRLRQRCRDTQQILPELIIAGRISQDKQYVYFREMIERLKLSDCVREIGYVPDQDLPILYRSCSLFFFPSLYEGFGLPPLEALATGAAVVSSKTSAMPEVLGECASYLDPKDIEQGIEVTYQALYNQPHTPELAARNRKQAGLFTWERTGEKTLNAYEEYLRQISK